MSQHPRGAGVLHLLLNAEEDMWGRCSACCAPEDTVLLIDRGVMGLVRPHAIPREMFACRVVASLVDARARGLPTEVSDWGIEFYDDDHVIALLETHAHCLSWR